jgi:hydroxyacylglutathione hydrolase
MITIEQFVTNPLQENTYIVYNEKGSAALIDPGCYYKEEQDFIVKFIEDKGLTIKAIWLTHAHLDHVFGLLWATELFKLEPYMHSLEEENLKQGAVRGLQFGLPFASYNGAYKAIADNERLYLDDDSFTIMHLPGHSAGSVGFYYQPQEIIISGDVLFKESVGRTDLPGGNAATLVKTIQEKLFSLPNETIVYNGHGQATTIGHEKKYNPFVGEHKQYEL